MMKAVSGLLLLLASACGGAAADLSPAAANTKEDPTGRVIAFQHAEDEVLRDLAALDRRVALRGRIEPSEQDLRSVSMGALLAEDKTLAVIDGAIDPFSFEARARGLVAVKAKIALLPSSLPAEAQGTLPLPSLERELLTRLVDEETVRLDEERALPRSASALVRGIVETWTPPATMQQAIERDRWLARRLAEIGSSLATQSAGLDVGRARELDDALDGLEHHMESSALARATAELVKLREVLEKQATRPAVGAVSDWKDIARGARVHLGFDLAPEILETRFAGMEKVLRGAAEKALASAHVGSDALSTRAAPLVFAGGACATAVPGSRVRSMAPPPERAVACKLRQAVTSATDAPGRAYALVAMHDHVVVAQWALDVARGSATIAQTTGRHRPMSLPGPDVVARWERIALARATAAIGGGLAADVLYGAGDPQVVAQAWSALGEVPLDIAERELALRPTDSAKR